MKRLAMLLALSLTGCFSYDAFLQPQTESTPDTPHVDGVSIVITQGSAVAVAGFFNHEEIEGSSTYAAEKIKAEDPNIVAVAETNRFVGSPFGGYDSVSRVVLLTGVRAGDTKLRITMEGGDHEGELTVRVVIP